MRRFSNSRWLFAGLMLSLLAASCGEDEKPANDDCDRGEEGCRCESDDACDTGLVCDLDEDECVRPGAGGSSGHGGNGGNGGSSGNSNSGRGGSTSGAPGSGGSNFGGSAGSSAGSDPLPAGNAGIGGSGAGESGDGGTSPAGQAGEAGQGGEGNRSGDGGEAGTIAPTGGTGGASSGGTAGTSAGTAGSGGSNGGATGGGGTSAGGAGGASGSSVGGSGGTQAGSAGQGGRGGSGGSAGQLCTPITPSAPFLNVPWPPSAFSARATYYYDVAPEFGTTARDLFAVGFREEGDEFDGARTGTFVLGRGDDASYLTCSRCVLLQTDSGTFHMASSGTLTVSSASPHMTGYLRGSLTNVTLTEVVYSGGDYVFVPGGDCMTLPNMTLDFQPPTSGWLDCPPYLWNNGQDCDCGCGGFDPDCTDETAAVCDDCWCPGDGGDCAGSRVDPDENSQCLGAAR